jgi:uncharacterized membrane protein YbhN (UPF0104 family)
VIARAAVTVALIGGILVWLPLGELIAAMARVGVGLWGGVLLGFAAGHALAALKWRGLLRAAGLCAGVKDAVWAHGAGLFANLCLPSLVGGDVVRAGWLARRGGSAETLAVVGLADRAIDTLALVALAAVGALWVPGGPGAGATRILAVAAVALLVAAVAAIGLVRRVDPDRLPGRLGGVAHEARRALAALGAAPAAAAMALGLALAIQAGFVGMNAALGTAVGIHVPIAVWVLAWPLAKLAALAPVSLGGIGVREAALAVLLAPFAVDPTLAVAQSLVWETILIALGLLAGGAWIWRSRDVPITSSVLRGDAP